MPYVKTWDEFTRSVEMLYFNDPSKFRFTVKYKHHAGILTIKATDDQACYLYKTEHAQDVRKLDKLTNQLMRHMASKESK